jgi:hypothetical protein
VTVVASCCSFFVPSFFFELIDHLLRVIPIILQDYVPKKLQVAHQIMGVGDYRLAVMNCSQELPRWVA